MTSSPTSNKINITEISFVLPAYNEELTILNCLNSIYQQNDSGIKFEVVIVDDCSTDTTNKKVTNFATENNLDNLVVLKNETNQGRFESRIRGIKQAKYSLIFLIDSRIVLEPTLLSTVQTIGYAPIMGTQQSVAVDKVMDLLYFLVRRKFYFPQYPKVPGEFVFITKENFSKCPKGTGDFLCAKATLLSSLPENTSKTSSDDTAWIFNIMEKSSIMIHNKVELTYRSRHETASIFRHLYERGPKFADFYIPIRNSIPMKLLTPVVATSLAALAIVQTKIAIAIVLGITTLGSIYLSRNLSDFARIVLALPLACATFGLGIIKGIIIQYLGGAERTDDKN